jgi:hypothetical protein
MADPVDITKMSAPGPRTLTVFPALFADARHWRGGQGANSRPTAERGDREGGGWYARSERGAVSARARLVAGACE